MIVMGRSQSRMTKAIDPADDWTLAEVKLERSDCVVYGATEEERRRRKRPEKNEIEKEKPSGKSGP